VTFHFLLLDDWVASGAGVWARDTQTAASSVLETFKPHLAPNAHVSVRGFTPPPAWLEVVSRLSSAPLITIVDLGMLAGNWLQVLKQAEGETLLLGTADTEFGETLSSRVLVVATSQEQAMEVQTALEESAGEGATLLVDTLLINDETSVEEIVAELQSALVLEEQQEEEEDTADATGGLSAAALGKLGSAKTASTMTARGNTEVVRVLLGHGASMGLADNFGKTALDHAVILPTPSILRLLIEAGGIEAVADRGVLALSKAIGRQRRPAAELLLIHGASTRNPDLPMRMTPLCSAAVVGWDGFLQTMIEQQGEAAGVDERSEGGGTPLMFAAVGGHIPAMQVLVQAGADMTMVLETQDNDSGENLLMIAAGSNSSRSYEVVKWILDHRPPGQLLVTTRSDTGNTVMHCAAHSGNGNVIALLKSYGADPTAVGPEGRTPLHKAAYRNNYSAASVLVKMEQVDVNAVDNGGHTALMYAVESGGFRLVKLLVGRGAQTTQRSNQLQRTLLMCASKQTRTLWPSLDLLRFVWELNPTGLDDQDAHGNTALHLAGIHGQFMLYEELLRMGASTTVRNREGMTPLEVADGNCIEVREKWLQDKARVQALVEARRISELLEANGRDGGSVVVTLMNSNIKRKRRKEEVERDAVVRGILTQLSPEIFKELTQFIVR
jgi:ankyrin repeat protein